MVKRGASENESIVVMSAPVIAQDFPSDPVDTVPEGKGMMTVAYSDGF